MKLDSIDIFNGRCCNECHSKNNIKELYLGTNIIPLCKECRDKLYIILDNEDEIIISDCKW